MRNQYPALIVAVPLLSSLLVTLVGWYRRSICYPIVLSALAVSCFWSFDILRRVIRTGTLSYTLGGWTPPFGIEFRIDRLNALVLTVIFCVALLNLVAGQSRVQEEFREKTGVFYALYLLFVTGLAGMTITGDAFNLYVLLEITALSGYALIGIGKGHAALASLNYLFIGTIGASFYLLGVGYLYIETGSLNMADLAAILPHRLESPVLAFAFALVCAGLLIKMALFPLHAWLPNAYAYSPSVASGLIAPLTTKVMAYVLVRMCLFVFGPDYTFSNLLIGRLLVWIAIFAIVAGSLLALAQTRLTRMLAYVVVAEIGYLAGGFWIGNKTAITGTILHIVNDAAMTLCLFLVAGSILHRVGSDRLRDLGGLFGRMPLTMAAFVVGAFSLIGVPPTCGFFSKWYLIRGGLESGDYFFAAALIFSSLANVILFFRIFEICYFEPAPNLHEPRQGEAGTVGVDKTPLSLSISVALSASVLIALGLGTKRIVESIIVPSLLSLSYF